MNAQEIRVSVFTPAYNSAHLIHRVYESLTEQTFRAFEWIIIDDGSADNTEEVVGAWIKENPDFPIIFHRFEKNRGKIAASNHAARIARGDLFLNFDADDRIKPHAIGRFVEIWDSLEPSQREELKGITAVCEDQNGHLVGTLFPEDPLICDYYDFKFKYKIKGEKFDIVRTDLMRAYPFHEEIDKHIVLSHVWFDMALKYKMYCINDILRIYYINQEHTSLSKSHTRKKLSYIKGRRHYGLLRINNYFHRIPSLKFKIQSYMAYIRYGSHMGLSFSQQLKDIEKLQRRLGFILIYPLGMAVVLKDRLQGRV